MGEIGKGRISRCADVISGHGRSFGPHHRNCQSGYYRYGTLGNGNARINSKIVAAKSLGVWAHDELRQGRKMMQRTVRYRVIATITWLLSVAILISAAHVNVAQAQNRAVARACGKELKQQCTGVPVLTMAGSVPDQSSRISGQGPL
jgi:hypothetical protein